MTCLAYIQASKSTQNGLKKSATTVFGKGLERFENISKTPSNFVAETLKIGINKSVKIFFIRATFI